MRLTDADALYETLCHIWDRSDSEEFEQAVFESIANAPTIEVPTWIPCSDRLPEEKGEYLVAYHPCYWDDVEAEVKVGVDSFRGKTSWAKQKYQRVIAWMSLPPIYQGITNK